jgi:hypothetical protein
MSKEVFAEPEWSIDTLPSIRGTDGDAINYPSVWPEGHYLLRGDRGYRMEVGQDGVATVHTTESVVGLNELLRNEELTPLSERVPVLAIGSNRAPRQLHDKFKGLENPNADDLTVPVFTVEIQGLDVVFAGRPSMQGNFPAVLYTGEHAKETTVELAITFLNKRQLEAMDISERGMYERQDLPGCDVHVGDKTIPVQYYRGSNTVFVDEHGQPRALRAIRAEGRTIPALNQADLFDLVLGHLWQYVGRQSQSGMQALEGIYFDPQAAAHREILRSYAHTPPYAQELARTIGEGRHITATEKPRMAGTAGITAILGELGLTTEVAVPEGFVASLRTKLSLTE